MRLIIYKTKTKSKDVTQREAGFSLIELMVVIGILALLGTIIAPTVTNWIPKQRVKGVARELFSNMQRAKVSAIRLNSIVTMNFVDGCNGAGSYVFTDGAGNNITNVTMQNDVCITTNPSSATGVGFTSRGLANGGTFSACVSSVDAALVACSATPAVNQAAAADQSRVYVITQSIAGGISFQ